MSTRKCLCPHLVVQVRIVVSGGEGACGCQNPDNFIFSSSGPSGFNSLRVTALPPFTLHDFLIQNNPMLSMLKYWWSMCAHVHSILMNTQYYLDGNNYRHTIPIHTTFFNKCVQVFIEVDAQTAHHTISPHIDIFILGEKNNLLKPTDSKTFLFLTTSIYIVN